MEKHLGFYSGVDTILEDHQHSDACRVQLTQKLSECYDSKPSSLTELQRDCFPACLMSLIPLCLSSSPTTLHNVTHHTSFASYKTDHLIIGFNAYPTYGFVYQVVLSISWLIFVGESHCRNKEWLQTISACLNEVFASAKELRLYHPVSIISNQTLRLYRYSRWHVHQRRRWSNVSGPYILR